MEHPECMINETKGTEGKRTLNTCARECESNPWLRSRGLETKALGHKNFNFLSDVACGRHHGPLPPTSASRAWTNCLDMHDKRKLARTIITCLPSKRLSGLISRVLELVVAELQVV